MAKQWLTTRKISNIFLFGSCRYSMSFRHAWECDCRNNVNFAWTLKLFWNYCDIFHRQYIMIWHFFCNSSFSKKKKKKHIHIPHIIKNQTLVHEILQTKLEKKYFNKGNFLVTKLEIRFNIDENCVVFIWRFHITLLFSPVITSNI